MSAAWQGTPEAVAILIKNGATLDIKDSGVCYSIIGSVVKNLLSMACSNGNLTMKMLVHYPKVTNFCARFIYANYVSQALVA